MNTLKRVLGSLRKADVDYHLIENGDKIAVGISGGKDSSLLLYCLYLYQRFSKKDFEVSGLYINLGFGAEDMRPLQDFFAPYGLKIRECESQIAQILDLKRDKKGRIECSLCSQFKKAAVINAAKEAGCNKVAFAHHIDDALETLLMNAIHGGRIATFEPQMHLTRSDMTFIRPLIYAHENDIARTVSQLQIPIVHSGCPNDGNTERQKMKLLLKQLYHDYPSARDNFPKMLHNPQQLKLWEPFIDEENEDQPKHKKAE
jgi:tRNA 2-thiocytidine biosynthesis protein TtcA